MYEEILKKRMTFFLIRIVHLIFSLSHLLNIFINGLFSKPFYFLSIFQHNIQFNELNQSNYAPLNDTFKHLNSAVSGQLTQKPTHPNKNLSTYPNSWITHPSFWSTHPSFVDDYPNFWTTHQIIFFFKL